MKTAQISIEFLFALGVIFLIFITLFLFTSTQHGKYTRLNNDLAIKNECLKLATFITTIATNGATVTTTSSAPFTIVNASRVILMHPVSCSIPLASVNGGNFNAGKIRIQKLNEGVDVRNV